MANLELPDIDRRFMGGHLIIGLGLVDDNQGTIRIRKCLQGHLCGTGGIVDSPRTGSTHLAIAAIDDVVPLAQRQIGDD